MSRASRVFRTRVFPFRWLTRFDQTHVSNAPQQRHNSATVTPRQRHGSVMARKRQRYGGAKTVPRWRHGVATSAPRQRRGNVTATPWPRHGRTMATHGHAMATPWSRHGIEITALQQYGNIHDLEAPGSQATPPPLPPPPISTRLKKVLKLFESFFFIFLLWQPTF
jgi:hypothetical protein